MAIGSTGRMEPKPHDTSREAWRQQLAALDRLGPAGRIAVALDLSESVRLIQLDAILARHPEWTTADAVRHMVAVQHGVALPRP
jgi:hypothetical protein